MIAPFKTKKTALVALMLALLGAQFSALIPTAQAYPVFAEPAFAQVWTRNDKPVAGDVATSVGAPTYAPLARVTSLRGDNRAAARTGQNIREGLGRPGNVGIVDNLAGLARYAVYEPTLGHNIADAFWTFMNQRGPVYENGRYISDTVMDWVFTLGYPITEPYWINIQVGNQNKGVLMQA